MNKRILSPLILFFLYSMLSYANPVDISTAQKIAKSFYTSKVNSASAKIKSSLPLELKLAYTASEKDSQNSYYIFNRENQNGFIIISGDDRTTPILGYADSGSFDYNTIPDNFKYWLNCYQKAIGNLSDKAFTSRTNTEEVLTPVEPLLGNIAYNQDTPYNNLCPVINVAGGKAVTGCAATAMAQIMKYHQYPAKGIGSHDYTTSTLKLSVSADFGNTTYDWGNMLETYRRGTYTVEQAEAIATLMFHCGVSLDMDYNTSSGAFDFNMARAFVNYFNYDASTIKLCNRSFYTSADWKALIKQEFNERRPIIYNGQSIGGGHSFVCDGYDENGLFHINWGWNGQSNGYFDLDILDPGTQGIGGGVAGFNYAQSIITGIKPLQGTQTVPTYDLKCMMMAVNEESITGNENAIILFIITNYGIGDFNGEIGLHLEADNDDVRDISLGDVTITSETITGSIPILSRYFPNGTYKLYPSYKANDSDQWQKMEISISMPEYILVNTQDGTTTFSDNAPQSNLEVSDFKIVGELVTQKVGTFEFTVTNTGEKEFNQVLGIAIQPKSSTISNYQIFWIEGMYLEDGKSKTVQYSNKIDYASGEYNAYIVEYFYGLSFPIHDTPLDITILNEVSSITDIEDGRIEIYPSLVTSNLYIHAGGNITNVQILDLSGKTVLSTLPKNTDNMTLNVESLTAGTYLVRVSTADKLITQKIIKPY